MEEEVVVSPRKIVRYEVTKDYLDGKITRAEAASALDISERAMTNLAKKVKNNGFNGVIHGNKGRVPKNKKPLVMKVKAIRLKKEEYYDFNLMHTLDKFNENHKDLTFSYSTFYRWCIKENIGKYKLNRRKIGSRKLRRRYPQEGYFIQMDGSEHVWFGEQESSLIHMIDDATGKILAGQFWPSESTLGCLSVLKELIENHGIPNFIYTDRAGVYGGTKRQEFSHFESACSELNIKIIYANSPQAKGRIERSNRTLQDRLIAEMRLAGIQNLSEANVFAKSFFKNEWTKHFAVEPENPVPALKALPIHKSSKQICSIKIKREIRRNSTISYQNVVYLLNSKPGDPKISSNSAELRMYPDGTWSVYVENRLVNLYVAPRNLQNDTNYMKKIKRGNDDLQITGIPTPLMKTG